MVLTEPVGVGAGSPSFAQPWIVHSEYNGTDLQLAIEPEDGRP